MKKQTRNVGARPVRKKAAHSSTLPWLCVYDPEKCYEKGLFTAGAFDDTLRDGSWPSGSIWQRYEGGTFMVYRRRGRLELLKFNDRVSTAE